MENGVEVNAFDTVVVGGFGHVGLPLAVALADSGMRVCAFDIDLRHVEMLRGGRMPFMERGGDAGLQSVLASGALTISVDRADIARADTVIVIIGTPVDRHLNPEFEAMRQLFEEYLDCLVDGQTVILRSTVFPGTTDKLQQWLHDRGRDLHVAFCPERIAEGSALEELRALPQIISGCTETALRRAAQTFGAMTSDLISLEPIEAELAKLFNNVWRYMQFAVANQFFMIAADHDVDFYKIYHGMTYGYPRAGGMPGPGFAAGPCLFKDTMQLAAFQNNTFYLGHAAMLINEGLPNYIVHKLKARYDLKTMTVGVLGMAFKANIDDRRDSLSYKLRKILAIEARRVICSDAYIHEAAFVPAEELVAASDLIILGTPHRIYGDLPIPRAKTVVDVWNFWGEGCAL
jgi:UDP-N-acetyl-D-mannosaminuronic acid dehydrogenase